MHDVKFETFLHARTKFCHPILIEPNYMYEIRLEIKEMLCVLDYYFIPEVIVGKKMVLDKNSPWIQRKIFVEGTQTIVRFLNTEGLVTGLILNIYDKYNQKKIIMNNIS